MAVYSACRADLAARAVSFKHGGRDRPPESRLHHRIDVAGVEAVARGFFPVDPDVQVRLAEQPENTEILDPADLCHLGLDLRGKGFKHLEVRSDDFDGVGAFDARQCLFDIVLDVLREIESDPGQFLAEFLLQLLRQFLLGETGRPFIEWP